MWRDIKTNPRHHEFYHALLLRNSWIRHLLKFDEESRNEGSRWLLWRTVLEFVYSLIFSPWSHIGPSWICLFVCLFRGFHPARECFTHMDSSPLPMKGSKIWPMLVASGHWVVRVSSAYHVYCDTGHPFIMVIMVR